MKFKILLSTSFIEFKFTGYSTKRRPESDRGMGAGTKSCNTRHFLI